MKREDIEALVEQVILDKIKDTNLELVDVEYVRERDWFLRVYLDKVGGLEIEDCQLVSETLTKYLDEKDPIKEKYYLEVSSPGLDRQIKKPKDFIRHKGHKVDISLFKPLDGKKVIIGELAEVDDSILQLVVDGKTENIERNLIANIRLHLDF